MKRARPAPSMFGNDSDSDHATRRPLSRFRPLAVVADHAKEPCEDSRNEDVAGKFQDEDTLDAFMSSLQKVEASHAKPKKDDTQIAKGDSDSDDAVECRALKLHGNPREPGKEYANENGEDHARDLKLQPVDYKSIQLSKVMWSMYKPLPRLHLSHEQLKERLRHLGAILYNGTFFPLTSFDDLALELPKNVLSALLNAFTSPTPIQMLAIPAALAGRDITGVAKTGSGKTVAYGIPLLSHVARQAGGSSRGAGPVALVLSPTRELATQITGVLRRFDARAGVLCVVGGHAKYEQFKRIRDSGAEVIVATPGRLIDMLKMRACGMKRCSFVVVDEADRMFDLGFTDQVRAVLSQIRPDAQRLLFSATFPKVVRGFAEEILNNAVRVVVKGSGGDSMVNENVTEKYRSFSNERERMVWLVNAVAKMREEGLVMVFCGTRGDAAAVANGIRIKGIATACIHGETEAADREDLLKMFRDGELPLLVTTDLSARGLDIEDVRNVVNYGSAKSWDWHVHRVGRTGRAGRTGTCWTLIVKGSKTDSEFVCDALKAYRRRGGELPDGLDDIVASGWEMSERSRGRARRRRGRVAGISGVEEVADLVLVIHAREHVKLARNVGDAPRGGLVQLACKVQDEVAGAVLLRVDVDEVLGDVFHVRLDARVVGEKVVEGALVERARGVKLARIVHALQELLVPRRAAEEHDARIEHEPVVRHDEVVRVVDHIEQRDGLINNHGISIGPQQPVVIARHAGV
ncbi:RNA helicase [Gracilaria domingensis]|nr:RNA helicase [Gracilaria domingensis]